MDSTIEEAHGTAGERVVGLRLAIGIHGVLSIVFAAVILIWPGLSVFALTILFGVFATLAGIAGLASAIRGAGERGRGWLVVSSLLGIVVGVMVLTWPDISALALLYVIGTYAVASGVIALGGAFWVPLEGTETTVLILTGLVSIVFGIVMFVEPRGGALALLALIAAFAIVTGIGELVVSIGGEGSFGRRAQAR